MFHRSIIRLATFLSFLEISRADVFQRSFEIFEKESLILLDSSD